MVSDFLCERRNKLNRKTGSSKFWPKTLNSLYLAGKVQSIPEKLGQPALMRCAFQVRLKTKATVLQMDYRQ
jgi:hypothetical protein